MIALIKIRGKYLYNHPCSVYWSYFFVPSIIIIFFFILLSNKADSNFGKLIEEGKINGKGYNLLKHYYLKI